MPLYQITVTIEQVADSPEEALAECKAWPSGWGEQCIVRRLIPNTNKFRKVPINWERYEAILEELDNQGW